MNIPTEVQRPRNIDISMSANGGFIVQVGCERFTFGNTPSDIHEMCQEVEKYLQNPIEAERDFHKKRCDESNTGVCRTAPPPPQPLSGTDRMADPY